jgi:hypothetical protein
MTTTATVQAGAKVQQRTTGSWFTLKKPTLVEIVSERSGYLRIRLNGELYSVAESMILEN